MAPRTSVQKLPKSVRDWLDKSLVEGNFSGYELLSDALKEKGYQISKSAVHRYGQKIEKRFAAIKASTEAARLLTEGAADDQDARSEGLIALVQSELFESMINFQEASAEDVQPQDRITLLSKAAKNISTLARASVNQKKFRLEIQAKAEAAAANVEKIAKKGGLSAESVDQLRREILGIAS